MNGIEYYAGPDVTLDRADIREVASLSVDMRALTGMPNPPDDETQLMPAGTFTLSVCGPQLPGEVPIGEIRFWYGDKEVRVVGHLTGRPGIAELTPDHLLAMEQDSTYRQSMLKWLGLAA